MLEKIHIYISMFAALVTVVYCILTQRTLAETAPSVIIAIIVFYCVGVFAKNYLNRTVFIREEFPDFPIELGEQGEEAVSEVVTASAADTDDDLPEDEDDGL